MLQTILPALAAASACLPFIEAAAVSRASTSIQASSRDMYFSCTPFPHTKHHYTNSGVELSFSADTKVDDTLECVYDSIDPGYSHSVACTYNAVTGKLQANTANDRDCPKVASTHGTSQQTCFSECTGPNGFASGSVQLVSGTMWTSCAYKIGGSSSSRTIDCVFDPLTGNLDPTSSISKSCKQAGVTAVLARCPQINKA